MAILFKELVRRTLLGLPKVDGEELLIVKQAVNDAIYTLAEVGDFPELFVRDETTATTVAETKSYHLVDDLGLTRPKSIFNILLIDNGNSRKLIPQTPAEMDLRSPYPENSTSGVPSYYALRGMYVEFYRIPDDAYDLRISYQQWPAELTDDDDESPFEHLDQQTVFLSKDIANSYMGGDYLDFQAKAKQYLGMGLGNRLDRRDEVLCAKPFEISRRSPLGEYWVNPFIRKDP